MKQSPECDCPCHPSNGLEKEQRRWQFGTIQVGSERLGIPLRDEPCWCCWCHYENEDATP